jgi:hypothetical protein
LENSLKQQYSCEAGLSSLLAPDDFPKSLSIPVSSAACGGAQREDIHKVFHSVAEGCLKANVTH